MFTVNLHSDINIEYGIVYTKYDFDNWLPVRCIG